MLGAAANPYDTVAFVNARRTALDNLERGHVETVWSDAVASSQGDVTPVQLTANA